MEKDICLHGISNKYSNIYSLPMQRVVLEQILESGAVLSLRMQGKKSNNGFNGLDFVSLCDYSKKEEAFLKNKTYNAYYQYIEDSLSLIFPKSKLNLINPIVIEPVTNSLGGYRTMKIYGEDGKYRFSDFIDEVQCKDMVSLEHLIGVAFPIKYYCYKTFAINDTRLLKKMKYEIVEVKNLLNKYGYNVPLYDIDTFNIIDESKLILKR